MGVGHARSTPNCIIRDCVLYELKVETNVADLVKKIWQAFGEGCVITRTPSKGDLTDLLMATSRWKMPHEQSNNDKELQKEIKEDSNKIVKC